MNTKEIILSLVLISVDVIILLVALVRDDLAPILIGALITSNVTLIIALLNQSSNSDDTKYDPKMILGKPPNEWPVKIGGQPIMGELIGSARLSVPREMMTVGPGSSIRLNPSYHYCLIQFANYAGDYRVPR